MMRRLPLFAIACMLSIPFGGFAQEQDTDEDATQTIVFSEPPAPPAGQFEYFQDALFLSDGTLLSVTSHRPLPKYLDDLPCYGSCGRHTPWGPDLVSRWDPISGKRLQTTQTADLEIIRVAPDGHTLAEYNEDTCCRSPEADLKFYDLRDMRRPARRVRPDVGNLLGHVEFSADSKSLFTDGSECLLRAWNPKNAKRSWTVSKPSKETHSSDFKLSPDGSTLLCKTDGKYYPDGIALVSAKTGRTLHQLKCKRPLNGIQDIAISPDGKLAVAYVISGFGDATEGNYYIWDAKTGKELRRIPNNDDPMSLATKFIYSTPLACKTISVYNDDNASCETSGTQEDVTRLIYFDVKTGKPLRTVLVDTSKLGYPQAYSHDGRYIAQGSVIQGLSVLDTLTSSSTQLIAPLPEEMQKGLKRKKYRPAAQQQEETTSTAKDTAPTSNSVADKP